MRMFRLKVPPLVWCLLCLWLMWWLTRILPFGSFTLPGQPLLALGFGLAGLASAFFGVAGFRRAQTTVDPRSPGKTVSLVRGGIYSLTRNPMYLGMLFVQLGWFLQLGYLVAFLPVLAFLAIMTYLQIIPEEEALWELFGEEYETYRSEVPRWLPQFSIPHPTKDAKNHTGNG